MGGVGVVEVIKSKGCSRLLVGISSPLNSFKGLQPVEPMSPASSSIGSDRVLVRSAGPFNGLVICVTGLSKGSTFEFYFLVFLIKYFPFILEFLVISIINIFLLAFSWLVSRWYLVCDNFVFEVMTLGLAIVL